MPKTEFGWKSYAQNKIGGQNCGNFDRIAKFAISSQSVRKVANFAMHLRNWQSGCEFGNAIANLAMWFAKLAKWFANLAMRIFAKVLKFYVRQMNSACGLRISQCCELVANSLPISQWLPTDCQFRNGCQLIAN